MKNPKVEIRSVKQMGKPIEARTTMHPQPASSLLHRPSRISRLQVGFCFLLSAFCFQAWGQHAMDGSTVDGGGSTSTGGVYAVSGTIGQPDGGTMSGGNHTLTGGFWGVIAAVQTPGAPLLTVVRSNSTVVVTWLLPARTAGLPSKRARTARPVTPC